MRLASRFSLRNADTPLSFALVIAATAFSFNCQSQPVNGEDRARTDLYGDQLPPRAVARLGTSRFACTFPDRICDCAYTADGKEIVSVASNSVLQYWDAERGALIRSVPLTRSDFGPPRQLSSRRADSLALSRSGTIAAIGDSTEFALVSLPVGTLRRVVPLPLTELGRGAAAHPIPAFAFMRGGSQILKYDFPRPPLIDVDSGAVRATQTVGDVFAIAPDAGVGARLRESHIELVDLLSNRLIEDAGDLGGGQRIEYISISREGSSLAIDAPGRDASTVSAMSEPRRIRIFDARRDAETRRLEIAYPFIGRVNLQGGHITLTTRLIDSSSDYRRPACGLRNWGRLLVSANRETLTWAGAGLRIVQWDLAASKERYPSHNGPICSIAFSRDSRRVATASSDKTVRIWDVATGANLVSMTDTRWTGAALSFSPDGARLAVLAMQRCWLCSTNDLSHTELTSPSGPFYSAQFAPRSERLALGGARCVCLVDTSDRGTSNVVELAPSEIKTPAAPPPDRDPPRPRAERRERQRGVPDDVRSITPIKFSPDGKLLAAALRWPDAQRLCVFDLGSNSERKTAPGFNGEVVAIDFSPDSAKIAVCGKLRGVERAGIIDAGSGGKLVGVTSARRSIVGTAFLAKSKLFLTVEAEHVGPGRHFVLLQFRNSETGDPVGSIEGDDMFPSAIAVSEDESLLAIACKDGTALVYDLPALSAHSE